MDKKKAKCMGIWYNMCEPNPDFQKLNVKERLDYISKKCKEICKK